MTVAAIRRELHYGARMMRCFAARPNDIDQMLMDAVSRRPDATALVAREVRLTYAELDRKVECIAANLTAAGFEHGDRLGLLVGNRPEFMLAVLAASRAGLIVVPMNIRQRCPEILYMLRHSEAKGLIYDASFESELPAATELPQLKARWTVASGGSGIDRPFETLLAAGGGQWDRPELNEEDPLCILYTSGTTGNPKGAILTHLGLVHSVMHYRIALNLEEGEVAALAVPASHVTGLVAILLAMIGVAGTTVMIENFKARNFLLLVEAERIGYTLMVPAMYKLCLLVPGMERPDLSSWRIGGFGGAPMPAATIGDLAKAIPTLRLSNIYGATETTSPVSILPPAQILSHSTTVGLALPCADIVVMGEDGREVSPGERGELLIAGPMTIPGYWRNPEGDAVAFAGEYWRSGDIGSVAADGFLSVHDRMKDVINRGGYKIYSIEVENVLAKHPDVVECGVVGYADDVLGERVKAVVSLVSGATATAKDLRDFCAVRLSDYKVPEEILLVGDALPRNANGKILKAELRNMGSALAG